MALTASEGRVAREAAPRELHRTVLGRLAAVSAALSVLLGAAAFVFEMARADGLMLQLASERSRGFIDHVGRADVVDAGHMDSLRRSAVCGELFTGQHLADDVLPQDRVAEVVALWPRDQQAVLGEQPDARRGVATLALDGVLQDLVRDVLSEDGSHVQRSAGVVGQLVDRAQECMP